MHFLSCAAAFLLMLLISADAAGRYLFNAPVKGAYEITELYLMIAIVLFGLGTTQRTAGHVRITLLSESFPAPLRRWLEVGFLAISLAVFGVATVAASQLALDHLLAGRTQGTLGLPVGPSWLILVVGLAAFCLRLVAQLLDCLLGRPAFDPPPDHLR
jgi:TRAP-type C4-dicarboxylate transport system permease small subunit